MGWAVLFLLWICSWICFWFFSFEVSLSISVSTFLSLYTAAYASFLRSSISIDLVLVLANIVKIIIIFLVVVIVILLAILPIYIILIVLLVLLVVAVFFQKCLQRLAKLPHVAQLPPHHHAHEPTHALEYAARQHRQAAAIRWTGLLVRVDVNGAASEHGIAVLVVEGTGIERPLQEGGAMLLKNIPCHDGLVDVSIAKVVVVHFIVVVGLVECSDADEPLHKRQVAFWQAKPSWEWRRC